MGRLSQMDEEVCGGVALHQVQKSQDTCRSEEGRGLQAQPAPSPQRGEVALGWDLQKRRPE